MKVAITIALVALMIIAVFLLIAFVVMAFWNILANYFGFKVVDYGIALIITLSIILVSSLFSTYRGKA